jgi:mannose-6-phosphate isomerase
MQNPVQQYAWGSRSFIQNLIGRHDLLGTPVAELWMGAHPKAPSRLETPSGLISLADFISSDPVASLGHGRHTGQLPFLMKVLAADEPLSIQAHPGLEQAREGFERETRMGLPLDSPLRNYRDPNHKPELICALTEFKALCGFRPYDEIGGYFGSALPTGLPSSFSQFAVTRSGTAFRAFFHDLLALEREQALALVGLALSRLDKGTGIPIGIAECCRYLQCFHPGDIGVLAPFFLNLVTLQPGQALFLPAGVLHSYLGGAGIELMANSDNVLRGGLTPKHVDVPELCRVLDVSPHPLDVLNPQPLGDGFHDYPVPVREFRLRKLNLEGPRTKQIDTDDKPIMILCISGEALISTANRAPISLGQGQSLFAAADAGRLSLSGFASLVLATTA